MSRDRRAGRPFRLLVFDWDGTLMDSAASIAGCMVASFRELGLEAIMDELGVGGEETLMVGDTTFDFEMARAAGAAAVAVLTGAHRRPELMNCGALECLDTVAELPGWLG